MGGNTKMNKWCGPFFLGTQSLSGQPRSYLFLNIRENVVNTNCVYEDHQRLGGGGIDFGPFLVVDKTGIFRMLGHSVSSRECG